MELRDYLVAIRRRWLWIGAAVGLSAAVAVALILSSTVLYTSTTRLVVTTPVNEADTGETQQRILSYPDLIEGDQLASDVISSLGLEGLDLTPSQLAEKVDAEVVSNTLLLDISVTDPSPLAAQQLSTAVAAEFIALLSDIEQPPSGGAPLVSAAVVDSANLPTSPSSPQVARTLALAIVLGLLVGTSAAFLREALDTAVHSADDVADLTGAPVLGIIGYDPDAKKNPIVKPGLRSARAENYRQLRTNVAALDAGGDGMTVVVTSPDAEAGKTTTAVNLALAFADADASVLLVDADLRHPRISRYLGGTGERGLTEVLGGVVDPADALYASADSHLHVLGAGELPPNPSELLQGRAMHEVLTQLRKQASMVIIDSPPLLPVTDAAVLAGQADGAILVARHGKTTASQLRQATTTLEVAGGRLLGVVLTMAPAKSVHSYAYVSRRGDASPTTGPAPRANSREPRSRHRKSS